MNAKNNSGAKAGNAGAKAAKTTGKTGGASQKNTNKKTISAKKTAKK